MRGGNEDEGVDGLLVHPLVAATLAKDALISASFCEEGIPETLVHRCEALLLAAEGALGVAPVSKN